MKRRIFLKDSAIGASAVVAFPTLLKKCPITEPPVVPMKAVFGFQEGAEFFDMAIAELRVAGNGEMGFSEAEGFDLSEGPIENLVTIAEQIYNKAEMPAEIPIDFAESAQELIDASSEMLLYAPELTPLTSDISSEIAEEYAFLKVLKSSSVLESAAEADPSNSLRAQEAGEIFEAAMEVYDSLESSNPATTESEFIEGLENLTAYSERYVGVSETFSGEASFAEAVLGIENSVTLLMDGKAAEGAEDLFAESENVFLSSEFYAEGIWNIETAQEILGQTVNVQAEELVPFAELLVAESAALEATAEGSSAEIGSIEMFEGAEEILAEASSDILEIFQGGETFEYGAEQYVAGTLAFHAEGSIESASLAYLMSAESIEQGSSNGEIAAEALEMNSEWILQASEDYTVAAEAFEFISGEYLVIEAPEIIESGPEVIEIYNSVPDGPNPEVIIESPNNIEIISADPVEIVPERYSEQIEIGGEIFNTPRRRAEIIAEVTEAEYVYPQAIEGIQSLEAATLDMFEGAEFLLAESRYVRSSAELNAAEYSLEGAEFALEGAIEAFETPEFVWDGAQNIEYGAIEMTVGASEFFRA